jgi:cathepsin L
MSVALHYAKLTEIAKDEFYPFIHSDGSCAYNSTQEVLNFSRPVMLPSGDEEALKIAVATIGPIPVAIDASLDTFIGYSEGIYYDPNCTYWLNHAVLVVGYGTDPIGGDYWIIKNTWSEFWGERGFMRLARNRESHCGISKYAVYVNLESVNNKVP